jgi:hypothetical protein
MADQTSNIPVKVDVWPELPYAIWQDSLDTVHRWTQIVGKIKLRLCPMVNHWWQVVLYVTSRGLTTSPIPCGGRVFQIDFDFIDHQMAITTDNGESRTLALKPMSVADFYSRTIGLLRTLGIEVNVWTVPVEVTDRTPFDHDQKHASYDREYVHRFWKALVQVDRVLKQFRSDFIGKASPVHFFWGAFDIAATRFSGRKAPEHPGAPNVAHFVSVEAYSHEVSSCGFWPGNGYGKAAFYAYAYPEPVGFSACPIEPKEAYYDTNLREFILPYEAVRTSDTPEQAVSVFLQSTYEAAADLGHWDRDSLERKFGRKR